MGKPNPFDPAFHLAGEGECVRCGRVGPGTWKRMFHQSPIPIREFYCDRCVRLMKAFGRIGLALLVLLLATFTVAVLWLRTPVA